jgi:beta-galactosidase/beta-glucuronidase
LTVELPRPDWTNLNCEWRFAFDDEDAGLARGWHSVSAQPAKRPIYVPGHGHRGEPILPPEFGGIAFSGEEG